MTSFSVVIPVYNGARFIPDALASVLGQTHAAHEVIVVNDGSTDNSLRVLKEYGNRIRIIDQPNAGCGPARNAGTRLATGDFVAFLDMDDYWRADKLEIFDRVVRHSGPHKPTFLFSDFVRETYFTKERLPSNTDLNPWIFEHLELVSASDATYVTGAEEAFRLMVRGYPIYPSTVVVARSRLNAVPWPEDFELGEDYSFNLLHAAVGPLFYVHQPLCVITRHDSNMSLDERKMAVSDIHILQWALSEDVFSPEKKAAIRSRLGSRLAGLGWGYRRDNRLEALKCYASAFRYPDARLLALKGLIRTLLPY
jgi:glycosyltransferase involved in cell wall biosynthesis